ncbi:hypothetical protein F5984_13230 [Rudanella paleaurantiibacter]|uniref:HK97 gp10 family phage protein n=1 Tax=Rudanella paleaurantiibacter TaxID=2614655 RepID=A0A7J5U0M6_9BACT|nr:HK97 gp10 family phage protein [Rudanella paleaurantiibacter]KAB7730140.1 hypothetical protein F5984_13230 [Rudanella paleaurantiibacter]
MMRLNGLDNVLRSFRGAGRTLRQEAANLAERAGRNIEAEAVLNAPVDTGKHRQSGSYEPTNNGMGAKVSFSMAYSPYLEFGTGGLVNVPPGFDDLASQFRGAGGRQINLPARPHLIPAFLKHREIYYNDLKRLLARL